MARTLASYGDIFCNDAFGSAPRPCLDRRRLQYMSTNVVNSDGKEIEYLGSAVRLTTFVAILGGAKVSDNGVQPADQGRRPIVGGGIFYLPQGTGL